MSIQTVILAGGKGTRLGQITEKIPKPMVPINDKPFILHLLEYLRSFGLDNILLLTGYMAERIEEFFEDGSKYNLSIKYSKEETLLGTGGALKNAHILLNDEFLLINGDTFIPIDYNKLLKTFYTKNTISTMSVYSGLESRFNNAFMDDAGFITRYNKKDPSGLNCVDSGVLVFKKKVLENIPDNCICSLEEQVFNILINQREMSAFVTMKKFYDIGTVQGIKDLEKVLK
jgi:N-acetyl-alpha-D-muramate 1-phosphate uridylyltransferase